MKRAGLGLFWLWMLATLLQAAEVTPAERMQWFRQAKFGMFIHWGVYAVPAGEWDGRTNYAEWIMLQAKIPSSEYEKLAKQFNPVRFNAREWVRVAKEAGMKYMVITAKHHDGFCMYDTQLTDYNIVKATPFGRDPMKELAEACREAGIKFCFYYSVVDWHHPEFPARYSQRGWHGNPNPKADLEKYVEYMKGQVRELLTNYGPIGILWFDGGGSFRGVGNRAELIHAQEIIDMIHELQPECLVNNRLGLPADYGTPEQHIPGSAPKTAFEVCMTLNRHWGYNRHDNNWKEAPVVIRNLADIASKGGNYLLNVGPTAEGTFSPDAVRILRNVGAWMRIYGESIYGTTASPFDYVPDWGRITVKGNRLYLHVFQWPDDGRVVLERLTNKVVAARLLGAGQPGSLQVDRGEEQVVIHLPAAAPSDIDSVVVLELDGAPQVVPKSVRQSEDGRVELLARDAAVHGTKAHYEYDKKSGKDNIGYWVDGNDYVTWDIKFHTAGRFEVQVEEACPASSAGTPFTVRLGDQTVSGTVEATGSFTDFRTLQLGTIALSQPGRWTLTVRPTRPPKFAVMNLRAVRLVPVK